MILYVQPVGGARSWYKIMDQSDLESIYRRYPMTREIAMNCDTLREAVEAIVDYLDGHHMSAWIENKELSKSLKQKALAIGMALGSAIPAVNKAPPTTVSPSMHPTPVQSEEKSKSMFGTDPSDRFLWSISQIESSGGKNTEHKPISSGKFKGKRAIGRWGLLRPTIHEILNRMRMHGKLTPEYEKLEGMTRDQLDEHFKNNPQVELDLARQLASRVLKRQHGNMHRAAYSWLHGHNLMPSDIGHDKLVHSDYVNKFRNFDKINPFTPKKVAMKKSMPDIDSSDFRERVKNWYKRRDEEVANDIMRTSNYTPDPGKLRDDKLDRVKPDSMKDSIEIIRDNTKAVNDARKER